MSATPETQAAILESRGQWSFALREKMETLERERDAARAEIEAMREVVAAAENCRHWHDCSFNPETGKTEGVIISAVSFWELHAALAKLQPTTPGA